MEANLSFKTLERIAKNTNSSVKQIVDDLDTDSYVRSVCFDRLNKKSVEEINNCVDMTRIALQIQSDVHRKIYQ